MQAPKNLVNSEVFYCIGKKGNYQTEEKIDGYCESFFFFAIDHDYCHCSELNRKEGVHFRNKRFMLDEIV